MRFALKELFGKVKGCRDIILVSCLFNVPLNRGRILRHLYREKMGLVLERQRWKQKLLEIEQKYDEVRFHSLWSTRIGEFLGRYTIIERDCRINEEQRILDVFVLSDCINVNKRLAKVMSRHICIIDEDEASFWVYFIKKTRLKMFFKPEEWNRYVIRSTEIVFDPQKTVKLMELSELEEAEAKCKYGKMKIESPFICIANRDPAYLETLNSNIDYSYHNYRDSSVKQFMLVAEYFKGKNIQSVRMGREAIERVEFENCIDYANDYYDELMDIVLMRDCKFYLGDAHGICILPMALNSPVALTNHVPMGTDTAGGIPQNSHNLCIFKKFFSKEKGEFLSLREMLRVGRDSQGDGCAFEKMGIDVISNTAEEILELAIEMNARLDGTWMEVQEDVELQQKFQKIMQEWYDIEGYAMGDVYRCNAGTHFLKTNLFLFKEGEN